MGFWVGWVELILLDVTAHWPGQDGCMDVLVEWCLGLLGTMDG